MRRLTWQIVPVVFFMVLCFFFWKGLSLDPHRLPSVQVGKSLPSFDIPELNENVKRFTNASLPKKVFLLNVWASWCQACVEEQVFMMKLAREGVPIYGLNYKDKAADAIRWLSQWGNPYQVVAQDRDGKLAIDLGVYGAPETFVIDAKGIIRYRHVGIMTEPVWNKEILPLMHQLEQGA